MIRAVIDTNVFASGIFWKGPPHHVLKAWSDSRFKLVTSASILDEYDRVLTDLATRYGSSSAARVLELVRLNSELVKPIRFAMPVCRDRDDDKFLATALAGGVHSLVSGDRDLLTLDGFIGIRVLKPKEFLSELTR